MDRPDDETGSDPVIFTSDDWFRDDGKESSAPWWNPYQDRMVMTDILRWRQRDPRDDDG